jgi:integrase
MAVRKRKLTKRTIDSLHTTEPLGERVPDSELTGFFLHVYPPPAGSDRPGTKVFELRYRVNGRRRRFRIGAYGALTPDEARREAKKLLARAQLGHDPAEERARRRGVKTFEEWATVYLARIDRQKKHPEFDHRYLGHAMKRWRAKGLDEITPTEVENFRAKLGENGHNVQANRALQSVRSCLSAAMREGLIEVNPAMKVKQYRENPPRSRTLTPDEDKRLMKALRPEDDFTRAIFLLMLETGCRGDEARRAKWSDIDFEGGLWKLPSPKGNHPQTLPLTAASMERLKVLPRISDSVFPGRGGVLFHLKSRWARVRDRAGLKGVTLHDLRRSVGKGIALEFGIFKASKILRHSNPAITSRIYAQTTADDLRPAVESRSRVIPFPPKKRSA